MKFYRPHLALSGGVVLNALDQYRFVKSWHGLDNIVPKQNRHPAESINHNPLRCDNPLYYQKSRSCPYCKDYHIRQSLWHVKCAQSALLIFQQTRLADHERLHSLHLHKSRFFDAVKLTQPFAEVQLDLAKYQVQHGAAQKANLLQPKLH